MLSFTENAIEYSRTAVEPGESIRVGVVGGGCSGMTYALRFETEIDEEDIHLDYEGVDIYIDPHSSELLKDTTIDYVKTLQRQGFVFMNPNANTTCGCGSSFS
jgi:iron-sulfur cluster assembly protein